MHFCKAKRGMQDFNNAHCLKKLSYQKKSSLHHETQHESDKTYVIDKVSTAAGQVKFAMFKK